jgi:hypothetical protein
VKRFLIRWALIALALLVEGVISYQFHPLNAVNTPRDALIVAFSYWPGMLIGYLSIWLQRKATPEEDPDTPAAAAICAVLWFVYAFRALTLLIHARWLSNWTEAPANWIVKFFSLFVERG